MKQLLLHLIIFFLCADASAQNPIVLTSGTKTSVRGLSVIDDSIIWASGSNGYIGRSTNYGKTFKWQQVNGFEERDFRDIEAFDMNTAVIIGIAEPAIILKTTDAGKTWKEVFRDERKGMFLDAMDFDKKGNGIVVGDPIDGQLFFAETKNFGDKWTSRTGPQVQQGEAFFASSGTNIEIVSISKKLRNVYYVTGGMKSRLFLDKSSVELKMAQGSESKGANSVAVSPKKNKVIIVGGDFSNDTATAGNCEIFTFRDNNLLFTKPKTPPHGYKSCVAYISDDQLICCGTSGVDISDDGGLSWQQITKDSYHVCVKSKNGKAVYLAGSNGRVARYKP